MMKKGKLGKFLALICSLMAGVMIFSLAACNDADDSGKELKLDKTTVSVEEGATATVNVTSSTTETIEWTVDKPDVATVVGSGTGNKLCTITGVAEGTATVTAKAGDKTATCAVTVTKAGDNNDGDGEVKDPTPVDVVFGGADQFENGWRYWTGDGDASVTSCINYLETNDTTISYNFTSGLFYSIQLFYKDRLTTGVTHDVALTIVSDVEANITVNGQKTELKVGDNEVNVAGYAGPTLSVQFGVVDESIVSGVHEFTFKDLEVTSHATVELAAPSFTYAADTKVITITDATNAAENVESYELGIFANATDEMPAYTVQVVNGDTLNMPKVPTGHYVMKLRAINSSVTIANSEWSASSVELDWTNSSTPLAYSEQKDVAEGSNTWYYWNQNWDPICTFEECSIEGNTINVKGLANNVGNTWSFQLFYKGTAGKKFDITITADNAGSITVNGTAYALEAGVAAEVKNVDASNIAIIFGDNPSNSTANNLQGNITLVVTEVA